MFPIPRLTYEMLATMMPAPILTFWYHPAPIGLFG
ncbi:hypothetical protein SAMN05878503_11520 [Cereibacter ovatus]|uniref:Uncharacterized protein n=1 Tax=Cereibacter ovatus TaxID=439529 RepID=A0A285D0T2_9RHOB|nr:hypothetical protein SAMN05878503_11520 [Cereibacter ovatus]